MWKTVVWLMCSVYWQYGETRKGEAGNGETWNGETWNGEPPLPLPPPCPSDLRPLVRERITNNDVLSIHTLIQCILYMYNTHMTRSHKRGDKSIWSHIGTSRKRRKWSSIGYWDQACILTDDKVLVSWSRTVVWRVMVVAPLRLCLRLVSAPAT